MKVVICGAMFHTDLKKNCNSSPADRLFSKPKCLVVKPVSYISGFRISDLNRILDSIEHENLNVQVERFNCDIVFVHAP